MDFELTAEQQSAKDRFREWVDRNIVPVADEHDASEETPPELIANMASAGFLGGVISPEYGGGGMDALTWGLLCEQVGRGSASLLSLLTVHGMVSQVISRWGSDQQRKKWLPKLASGEVVGAFGLSEPKHGSDAGNIESEASLQEEGYYLLNGEKRWISYGMTATLFLIFAKADGKMTAFLVERNMEGFRSEPIRGMLGFRAAGLARLVLKDIKVPAENVVGKPGFGFSHIASTALDLGRYCIAWGCTGLSQAALDAALDYSGERKQFGKQLNEHQLIQEMLSDMIVNTKAARLMCYHAAFLKESGEPSMLLETSAVKYYTSRVAVSSANSAIQIHGANGFSSDYPVQRYYRDAKIMEVIEGSSQIQQIIIARSGYQQHLVEKRDRAAKVNTSVTSDPQ
ncbi:MAG: acyl-CoA dehydrogenase family protein [Balneolaceae bacterium]